MKNIIKLELLAHPNKSNYYAITRKIPCKVTAHYRYTSNCF